MPQIPRYLGNFPDSQVFGTIPRFLKEFQGVLFFTLKENSQMPSYFGNFPNTQRISQIPRLLGNLSDSHRHLGNFPNF